jgi:hypothetical protein
MNLLFEGKIWNVYNIDENGKAKANRTVNGKLVTMHFNVSHTVELGNGLHGIPGRIEEKKNVIAPGSVITEVAAITTTVDVPEPEEKKSLTDKIKNFFSRKES